ncbi:hypothetical protein V8E53_000845 [Lactarius tabidus]
MMAQHLLSPLSHAPVRHDLESPWDLASMGGLGSSMKPWSLLVADASISGTSSSSSPLLPTKEPRGNRIYPRTIVGQGTKRNVHNTQLEHLPKHHPTLYPSNETPVQQSPYSLLYVIPGSQTRVKVSDDHFVVKVDSMADSTLRKPFPRFDIRTSQFPGRTDHGREMSEGADIPMMSLSDDCSSSPMFSITGATTLNLMPQESNEASWRDSEGEQLGAPRRHPFPFNFSFHSSCYRISS